MTVLDHLVFAVADLDAGRRWLHDATGVEPALGGAHPGKGTHNALASLGDAYLELIAPDPAQPAPAGGRPFGVDGVAGDGLVAFAIRPAGSHDTLEAVVDRARAAGYEPGPIHDLGRRRPDGAELRWRNTFPPPGGVIPFIIEWGATPMPSRTATGGLDLVAFEVRHPDPGAIETAYAALELDLPVVAGDPAGLHAIVRGPAGEVALPAAGRR